MQVTNPGSAGSGTVQTDGVTIQGDGSAGNKIAIKQVETDATLTGAGIVASPLSASPIQNSDGVTLQGNGTSGSNYAIKAVQVAARLTGAGTVASPLDVAGTPLAFFNGFNFPTSGGGPTGANQLYIGGFVLEQALRFGHIGGALSTGDAGHNCDLGIYSAAGTLLANIGAQVITSTSLVSYAIVQGTVTLNPGLYLAAFTSNGTTAKSFANNSNWLWFNSNTYSSSAGGALPGSITAPTLAPGLGIPFFILYT
jgi:hypothetical protein